MIEHPAWVWKRAAELLNEGCGYRWFERDRDQPMQTVANLVAKYEQEPVDPDAAVVQAILKAWRDYDDVGIVDLLTRR